MHISEGVLSAPVLLTGYGFAAAGCAVGLKKLDLEKISQAGVLSAAFFIASLIHVPLGPSNVHLIMNGIIGLILGWAAFPVILSALLLQAFIFQFGGLTTLGVNTVIMAVPSVCCHYLFLSMIHSHKTLLIPASFLCGFLSVLGGAVIAGFSLYLTGDSFKAAAYALMAAHLPVMILEGIITSFSIVFIKKVYPEILMDFKS